MLLTGNENSPDTVRDELIKITREWGAGQKIDFAQVQELRNRLVALNHRHYVANIPIYQKLAFEEGISGTVDIETIKRRLTFSDDIFKSYRQDWLDGYDFTSMNDWLSGIFHRKIEIDVSGITDIDDWADRLEGNSVKLVYSSGTSGAFSFVPRETHEWARAKNTNISCLSPLLVSRLIPPATRFMLKLRSSQMLTQKAMQIGMADYDAVFLGFRQGRMGNQALIQELASLFPKQTYLYDLDIAASTLRALTRGQVSKNKQELVDRLRDEVAGSNKESNYLRIIDAIKNATQSGRKVFIFGAPYQFKELCGMISSAREPIALKKGSLVLFGGGWKSFSGETVGHDELVKSISGSLGIPPEMVLEGYSMTEINVLMLRCEYGRFHIPPLIEPIIYDDELEPIEGPDIRGRFGFLDTIAVSYPGFVISGDAVHLVDSECQCGLSGPAILEIGRASGHEIKGCGGIMGSFRA
jgi:hypothetical protein